MVVEDIGKKKFGTLKNCYTFVLNKIVKQGLYGDVIN